MGLCLTFQFQDGKTVDSYMRFPSFPNRVLARLSKEQSDRWFHHMENDAVDLMDGSKTHRCEFVKLIFEICKRLGYYWNDVPESPTSLTLRYSAYEYVSQYEDWWAEWTSRWINNHLVGNLKKSKNSKQLNQYSKYSNAIKILTLRVYNFLTNSFFHSYSIMKKWKHTII